MFVIENNDGFKSLGLPKCKNKINSETSVFFDNGSKIGKPQQ